MPILEPQGQGFYFKFWINVHCHERLLLCIFLVQTSYALNKIAHQREIFGLLSGWVKIHQIPHVILETRSQGFF